VASGCGVCLLPPADPLATERAQISGRACRSVWSVTQWTVPLDVRVTTHNASLDRLLIPLWGVWSARSHQVTPRHSVISRAESEVALASVRHHNGVYCMSLQRDSSSVA